MLLIVGIDSTAALRQRGGWPAEFGLLDATRWMGEYPCRVGATETSRRMVRDARPGKGMGHATLLPHFEILSQMKRQFL